MNAAAPKPRVLFMAQLPPPIHGAAVVSMNIIESAVVREAFDLDVVDISTAGNVDDIGKVGIVKLLKTVALVAKTARKLLLGRYDLVYLTLSIRGPALYKDALLAIIAKKTGRKVVYHLHAKGMRDEARRSTHKRWLYRRVFTGADVILLSPLLREDLEPVEGLCQVHYLANGIESLQQERTERLNPPTILFLSNLLNSKGIQVLLEAVRLLAERNSAFRLIMAGVWGEDTEARTVFERQIQEGKLAGKIQLVGPVLGNAKSALLNSADIFVLPTLDDCFPLVLLEAMSCGLPIVSTRVGAIPEIVRDGADGFLVDPRDAVGLAERLKLLLKDAELRERLGQAAHSRHAGDFELRVFERDFVRVSERVLQAAEAKLRPECAS